METIHWPLVVAPMVISGLVMLFNGWRQEMQWRKKRTEEIAQVQQPALPEGSVQLYTPGGQGAIKAHLAGTMMLIAIGTFGVKQLLRLLILLYQTGLDWIVGSILVAEMDTGMRERFLNTVPKKYLGRIIFGYSKEFAGGMANMPIDWILANIKLWGTAIKTAAEDVIDLQLRLNDDHAPSTIYAFVSSGGHVPVGLPAIEIIAQRFEGVPIIAFTSLPHLRRLRERFGRMKSEYEARGVHGWVVVDALCSNLITADTGMVVMLEAMVQAALTADVATQANNVFMMALPEERGGILIYQVVALSAVAHFHYQDQTGRNHYRVSRQAVEREIVRGFDTVKQGKGIWSASLPIGEPLTSTFDIVATMVDGTELRSIADDVRESLRLDQSYNTQQDNGSYFDGPDYQLLFGSLAIVPDAAKPMCDVYVIRLQAVRDAEALVPEIIKVPGERTVPVLPPPVAPALPSSSLPSSSHKQDEDDDEQPPTQAGQNTPSDPSDGMNGSTNGPRRRGRPRGGKA